MIIYRKVCAEDVKNLKKLWLSCFSEREDAAELFFKRNSATYNGYCACDGSQIISALYLIDCTLCGKKAHYLCGAATLPEYRRRGIMSDLIEFALTDAEARGDCFSALLPANEKLYGYYAGRGYHSRGAACTAEFDCKEQGSFIEGEPDIEKLQKVCFTDKFLFWNNSYVSFAEEYYARYGVKTVKSANAFALYEQKGEYADVFYAAFNDIKELKSLLYAQGIRRFSLTGSPMNHIFKDSEPEKHGMLRTLNNSELPDIFFIGITLD